MWIEENIGDVHLPWNSPAICPTERSLPTNGQRHAPIAMLGIAFDNVTFSETLTRIDEMVASRRPHYIATANVDFLIQAQRDAALRRILLDAHLVLCDGTPLIWFSRFLNNPLPERVAGADLVPQLLHRAAERGYRVFFLGATPEANAQAAANAEAEFPRLNVSGHYSPPFLPLSEMDHEEIRRRITNAKPDLLFVAFGCPKAEKWMAMHHRSLGVPVMIGVGGTLDFLAGNVERAPVWMQRAGAEWLFRVCQEPRRLARRYIADLWHFIPAMVTQLWRMKRSRAIRAVQAEAFRITISQPTWERVQAPECLDVDAVGRQEHLWNSVGDRHRLLDLAQVKHIDSTGIALLLHWRKKIEAAGRCLVLSAPSQAVTRALESMRVQDFFLTATDALEARRLVTKKTKNDRTYLADGFPRPSLGLPPLASQDFAKSENREARPAIQAS
jgi:N-acetylglucosaminyldiphosphoundecaprenol N-acetyl-beta-D-mannosaminyltransferase